MQIEVWKPSPLGGASVVRQDLTMFLHRGRAYATWSWTSDKVPWLWIPVEDDFAGQVLGAERRRCTYEGAWPRLVPRATEGFTCINGGGSPEGQPVAVVSCSECGYTREYPGDLRSRVHNLRPKLRPHPAFSTRLVADKDAVNFAEADWDEDSESLAESLSRGRLVVWSNSIYSPKRIERAFTAQSARLLYQHPSGFYTILCVNE